MKFYWHEFETSPGSSCILDTFYGTSPTTLARLTDVDQVVLGAGSSSNSGLVICESGYRTVLKSECAAVVLAESGWFRSPKIPKPVSAAVSQQWLRIEQLPLHAALISFKNCGLIIMGDSNAGKSTLTRAAQRAGAGIISDDYIRVQNTAAGLIGHRVRGFLRERNVDGDRCSWLGPEYRSHKLDALLILDTPKERPAATEFAACSRLSLAMALIRQSAPLFMQGFELEGAHMRKLIAHMTQLPAVKLSTGMDVKSDPDEVLRRIIHELGL